MNSAIIDSVSLSAQTPLEVRREFLALTEHGARIQCVGSARRRPRRLLALGYVPRYKLELFGVTFYLSEVRKNVDVRFSVAYVAIRERKSGPPSVYARLFYKDGSLLWRSASHFARSANENWIGKGDLKLVREGGEEFYCSDENTTDLPLEMQTALETAAARAGHVRKDTAAVALVLRRSSDTRLMAYHDFTGARRRASRDKRNLVNGGKLIARFTRTNDPSSLTFVRGYEPDFSKRSVLEVSSSFSRLYGGRVRRFRVLSRNRRVQYFFFSSKLAAWIGHPQAITTELSRYGVRTVDVHVPDDLVVPGMEYHYLETEDPPVWMSQIPPGFAGAISPDDPWRASAAPWIDQLPVIKRFRRRLLDSGRS